MSVTIDRPAHDDVVPVPESAAPAARPPAPARPRWPIFGIVGGAAAFASVAVSMPTLTERDYAKGVDVIDQLDRSGYHLGFLLGLVSVGCLFVAAAGWRRWAEDRAPRDLAARAIGQGLAATATINVVFVALMGSMAIYLPGGSDAGWLSRQAIFTNFTLLDFGPLLGWWGAAVSAIALATLAFRRDRLVPRWMGVVSVLLLLPPLAMAALTGLPGFVGFTLPIWLVVISVALALKPEPTPTATARTA
jgi:hypothetical protein